MKWVEEDILKERLDNIQQDGVCFFGGVPIYKFDEHQLEQIIYLLSDGTDISNLFLVPVLPPAPKQYFEVIWTDSDFQASIFEGT